MTNALWAAPVGTSARTVERALSDGVQTVSNATLDEPVKVLDRPESDDYPGLEQRRRLVGLQSGIARLVPITRQLRAAAIRAMANSSISR